VTSRGALLSFACALLTLASAPGPVAAQESGEAKTDDEQAAQQGSNAPDPAPKAARNKPELHLLEDRLTIREPFNQASDALRIVAFLSPSCDVCLNNASQLQRGILNANEDADIAAYLVWMYVRKDDDRAAALKATSKVPDPRARHYWDPDRKLMHQLRDAVMFDVNMRLYDLFLLYDRETVWEKRLPRPDYWMHEFKGLAGPWWNVKTFAAEVEKGLRGEPFSNPWQ
jgi:hypothetical protein